MTDLDNAALGAVVTVNGAESDAATYHWPITGSAGSTLVWYNVFTYGTAIRATQWATQAFSGTNQNRTWVREKHDSAWSAWREQATKDYADTKLPLAGGTLTGPLVVQVEDNTAAVGLDNGLNEKWIEYKHNGVRRISCTYNNTLDSYNIVRYDLSGNYLDTPFTLGRNTGLVTVPGRVDIGDTRNASKLNLIGWGNGRGVALLTQPSLTGTNVCQLFLANGGGQVGSISTTDSNTQFNTTSDYRLKQNWHDIPAPLESLMRIRFYEGEYKAEPGKQFLYVIAHELQEVVPTAVSGEKDAMGDWHPVLREGADPQNVQPGDVIDVVQDIAPQQVDYSKLVPLLGAALQELTARVAALESQPN
ncbi:pyocin knob domain-containing S74 family peptidase [Cupriavidus nantongensis]|uniref:Peptidase S74 domain-containing protein n=1 Tax=Cupriavidus nantongensis TaxID=1796606 RepID=A0A142JMZ8_9BURK|nr:pyocin knob domain-containing S74 family peptidase [Cupriavidus nantongensis]AMR79460.1 hypothetical protein A2G96_17880 [Cupriavidus nantongensis]